MTDHVLDRIVFDPKLAIAADAAHHPSALAPIPWPAVVMPTAPPDDQILMTDPLHHFDSVIVTWTAAEWMALTDVLDPSGRDVDYTNHFDEYLPDLTDRSPARDARCLARFRRVVGNGKSVLLVHSMLHLATDGPNLPLRRLVGQIIDETGCERLITTGTAGGIGAGAELGDVVIGARVHFNCAKQFADAPFAHASYVTGEGALSTAVVIKDYLDDGKLIGANLGKLASVRSDTAPGIAVGTIQTTDFFAFDASDDHFGLRAYDPDALAVEMDDSVFGLVIADRMAAGKPCPWWTAVRNVSDPMADVTKYATFEDAATAMGLTYRRWGYWTSVPSVIISWLLAVA